MLGAIRIDLGNYTFLNNFIFMFIYVMTQCNAIGNLIYGLGGFFLKHWQNAKKNSRDERE